MSEWEDREERGGKVVSLAKVASKAATTPHQTPTNSTLTSMLNEFLNEAASLVPGEMTASAPWAYR
jgi:hypothetical protein